ncbi:MAG TPA: pyrimidine-nucleoside phosphorylase [Bacillales bacterium]|nr:pyrimidine-nucleoside phosphorylase [Bacillales bacterium]
MRMVDLIEKKRDGHSLTAGEIRWMVEGYTDGSIPDYQMSAMAMAIFFQDMNGREIADLTLAMAKSGDTIDLSPIHGIKVDKHSTGGVGDKTTLIVGPLVAAAGVPVAKMSGRGLGHTGGTIDKLEAIDGFRTELSEEEFIGNVNRLKMAIAGQSGNLTPADKKLYGLRDVTATVDSIPLIASSVMSKKIASGADAIVLDVKTGSGAFMKTLDGAKQLAAYMVEIGKNLNRRTIAVISDMNQPLGCEVGNANEIREAIEVLQGKGENDLTEVCLTLASYMTVAGGVYPDFAHARRELEDMLSSGKAIEVFKHFVEAQGGDPEIVENFDRLPQAIYHIDLKADQDGYIENIEAESVGVAAMLLGAGRRTKEDVIDHGVGITLKKKVGDPVRKGETIAVLHSNDKVASESERKLQSAFSYSLNEVRKRPMIYEVIE